MLPGIDGLGLLAALCQSKQTPVLMLTARIQVEDRVKGLQGGADDYLVKPFAFSELVARVQVLLRRARPALDDAEVQLEVIGDTGGEFDLPLLQRALLNLVANATRYAARGSTIRIEIDALTGGEVRWR